MTTIELRKRLDYYKFESKQLTSKLDDGRELRNYSESRIKILENQINAWMNSDFENLKNFDPVNFVQVQDNYLSDTKKSQMSEIGAKSLNTSPIDLKYFESADVHYKKPARHSHHRKQTDQNSRVGPTERSNVYESNYFTGFGVNRQSSDKGFSNRASSMDRGFSQVEVEADYYKHRYYDMLREKDSEIYRIRNKFAEVKGGKLREIDQLKQLLNEGEDGGNQGAMLEFIGKMEKPLKTESSQNSDVKKSGRGVNVSEFSVKDTELR